MNLLSSYLQNMMDTHYVTNPVALGMQPAQLTTFVQDDGKGDGLVCLQTDAFEGLNINNWYASPVGGGPFFHPLDIQNQTLTFPPGTGRGEVTGFLRREALPLWISGLTPSTIEMPGFMGRDGRDFIALNAEFARESISNRFERFYDMSDLSAGARLPAMPMDPSARDQLFFHGALITVPRSVREESSEAVLASHAVFESFIQSFDGGATTRPPTAQQLYDQGFHGLAWLMVHLDAFLRETRPDDVEAKKRDEENSQLRADLARIFSKN